MLDALGLKAGVEVVADEKALALMNEREEARKKKDWARSDKLRDELKALGYGTEDTPQGPKLRRIS
jgi:cysteinyl-tRNA synthetase